MYRHAAGLFLGIVLFTTGSQAQVSGLVVDENGLPVAGARVSVQASAQETVSDSVGAFSIPDASGDVVLVAGLKGYFYGSSSATAPAVGVSLQLQPVPVEDDPAYEFADPLDCAECHPSQYSDWLRSPMAQAGKNTWVYDIFDGTGTPGGAGGFVYLQDSVHRTASPASECRSCHQPEAWSKAPFTAMAPLATAPELALHGITCEVCHKMANIDVSRPNFPGIYPGVVEMSRPSDDSWNVQYGVLGDVTFSETPLMFAAYQPQLRAEICAACHQDKNDHDLDGDFEDEGGVISEPTYLEWLASPYADLGTPKYADCVDCHMPANEAPDACTVNPDSLRRPAGDVRGHSIEGTTARFLENAVTLSLDVQHVGPELEVGVTILNDQTGHHVPTGVTIRNMILRVEAWRESDGATLDHTGAEVVHDLGGVGDPAQGYFAGLPGKLYGKVNHDATGAGPTFFTDATGIQFDNRILATESDTTRYTFAVPADGGELHVRASLVYRRSWRALVDAKGWTEDGHGNPLADIAPPHFGHLMEEAEQTVPVAVACTSDGDCSATGSCVAGACEPPIPCTSEADWAAGQLCSDPFCTDPPPASAASSDDGGCGCRTQRRGSSPGPWGLLLGLGLLGWWRRR